MTVNVGRLFRKRTVRNLSGNIIDLVDEANGGVLISKGRVVNQERINELAKIEEDRKNAATAFTVSQDAPEEVRVERTVSPSKVESLEKKVASMEDNIVTILKLLQK